MAKLVGNHQTGSFTEPYDGQRPISASHVTANDDALRVKLNAHDNNAVVHVQSGTSAERPAAGTEGRWWFSTDLKRLEYDTGSAWTTEGFSSGTTAQRPATGQTGDLYWNTSTNQFNYWDGASWSVITPGSGASGTGTTDYLTKWTSGTTLGASGIRYRTIVGRTFLTADKVPSTANVDPLPFMDFGSGNWLRIRRQGAGGAQSANQYVAEGNAFNLTANAVAAANQDNGLLQTFVGGATTPAYLRLSVGGSAGAFQFSRNTGFCARATFRVTSGLHATAPPFVVFGLGSVAFSDSGNDDTANFGGHVAVVQFSETAGQWRLVTQGSGSSTKTNLVATTSLADGDEYELWLSVAAGSSNYDWAIIKNGSSLGSGTVSSPATEPSASQALGNFAFGVNSSGGLTEPIMVTSLFVTQ